MVGQAISHYKITEKLGEGGMGVVYKADDTKLDRPVALKFLAAHAIEDPEHKARFVREAKAAARLDHQNICPVHEIDEADGHTFLAMAYLEGRTVKDKVAERPLKLDEALDITVQTAQGLQAAHEKDIVHRDIKSANLMVTPQGQVKIMDFGLAQLAERSKLTETSTILGTPAYMSPEQAVGEKTDRRTDLWSLGVVLYEMVTGRLPFEAERQEAVLFKISSDEPEPVTALRAGLPMELEWIIGKALAKDSNERYQHAEDVLVDLRSLQKKLASGKSTTLKPQPASQTGGRTQSSVDQMERAQQRKQTLLVGATALAVLLALTFAFFPLSSPAPATDARVLRFSISPENLTHGRISPDGNYVLYATETGDERALWLRPLDSETPRKLEGTEGARRGYWWPDSKAIVIETDRELKRISVDGGDPITLCELPSAGRQFEPGEASWSPDGNRIVFSAGFRLYEIPARGGEPKRFREVYAGMRSYSWSPHFLPSDGASKGLLYTTARNPGSSNPRVALLDLETGEHRELTSGEGAVYSKSGHLIYHSSGSDPGLQALPFSLKNLAVTGEPFPIEGNGRWATVAADGTLVYNDSAGSRPLMQLVWKDRAGTTLSTIGQPQNMMYTPSLSPDGRRVAASGVEGSAADIWLHEVQRPVKTRLTIDENVNNQPSWVPPGDAIAFASRRLGNTEIFVRRTDGNTPAEPLLAPDPSLNRWLTDWSKDARLALFYQRPLSQGDAHDIWYLRLANDGSGYDAVPFLQTPFSEFGAQFSPDEKWVAYASAESGRYEVYVRSFPDGGNKQQVSVDGGWRPRWSEESGEIFYVKDSTLMVVPVSTNPAVMIGKPQMLFASDQLAFGSGIPTYDVTPDGQRFVLSETVQSEDAGAVDESGEKPRPSIRIVRNWYEEFRDRE